LSPEAIKKWCQQAGLSVVSYNRQMPEHYMLIAKRHASRG
jgi:TusA-related sulfurtransferase